MEKILLKILPSNECDSNLFESLTWISNAEQETKENQPPSIRSS